MNSEVCDVEFWLSVFKAMKPTTPDEEQESGDDRSEVNSETKSDGRSDPKSDETFTKERKEKNGQMYFLSFSLMSYNRESKPTVNMLPVDEDDEVATHRLVIHDLKGAWTRQNRDVIFFLFDLLMKAQQLKRNLSTDALKGFCVDGTKDNSQVTSKPTQSSSPASTMNRGNAASMLQKLISDSETKQNIVYTEDIDNEIANDEVKLRGISACQGDVLIVNWMIELVNSQVMLRGTETKGYVIASAAKTQILQKIHRPVWKEGTLYSKVTWVGSVDCCQYYATVDAGQDSNGKVYWLSLDNIEDRSSKLIGDLPDLIGSGHSVGGVVNSVADADENSNSPVESSTVQLQRIISRCSCQFYFVTFNEDVDPELSIPEYPKDDDLLLLEPWDREIAVDSFTLTHHELDICTNSQQFAMIMDLVNNLLLYVEPRRKEAFEKLQRMRLRLQMSPIEDQKEPILKRQDHVRLLVSRLKLLEKEHYKIYKSIHEEPSAHSSVGMALKNHLALIEREIDKVKENLNNASEELAMMISCYKEAQILADKNRERQAAAQETGGTFIPSVVRRIEVCFKQACWRLTDEDGQIGLADLLLNNFLYSKVAKNDDSVEHTLELGLKAISCDGSSY